MTLSTLVQPIGQGDSCADSRTWGIRSPDANAYTPDIPSIVSRWRSTSEILPATYLFLSLWLVSPLFDIMAPAYHALCPVFQLS